MRKIFHIIVVCLLAAALCSCTGRGERVPVESGEVTLSGLEEGRWIYFSLEDGCTVGSSAFLSEEEDASWAARDDWDFAICGDYIKTNGGDSGCGDGGLLRDSEHNFQTLTEAPAEGYLQDRTGIVK